jgi:hypothetical protein
MKTENEIILAPIPTETNSYKPVPNEVLINEVQEQLYKANMRIVNKRYNANANFTQMFATYEIEANDSEQRLMVGFRNSYDKSLAVGLVAGSSVIVCSNLMFKGDIKILRKHTTNVFRDLDGLINNTIDISYEELESNLHTARNMKQIEMSKTQMAEEVGKMFIQENLINSTQLNIFKNQLLTNENFTEPTKWTFYNHLTEALKTATPQNAFTQHKKVTDYVLKI